MKLQIGICVFFVFQLLNAQQNIQVAGQVIDATTLEPLSLVNIVVDSTILDITDINGEFNISDFKTNGDMLFTHIGYEPNRAGVEVDSKTSKIIVKLKPKLILLDEIIVEGKSRLSGEEIAKKVADNLSKTLRVGLYQAKGFQRKYRKRDGKYVFFAEAFIDQVDGGHAPVGYIDNIVKAKEYRISNQDFTRESFDINNYRFPISYPKFDSFLVPLIANENFIFQCNDTISKNGTELVVLVFRRKENIKSYKGTYSSLLPLYQFGEVTVNLSDWTVRRISLKGTFVTAGVKREELRNAVFEKINGKLYLAESNILTTLQIPSCTNSDYSTIISEISTCFSEVDTTSISYSDIEKYYNCKVAIDDRFGVQNPYFVEIVSKQNKVVRYDSSFWNSIPNISDWNKVSKDLEELFGIPLEKQFASNSEYLFSELDYVKYIKNANRSDKRLYRDWYKELKKYDYFNDK